MGLLMEIVLVMKLSSEEASQKCTTLGLASALMIILGYPGELIVEGDLSSRWNFWFCAMVPFCYIVYELVDLPSRLRLPHAWFCGGFGGCAHPGGVLRLRRHLQVRCWTPHLQHH